MKYLCIFENDGQAHGGLVPELNVTVTGKTPEQVRERLQQGIAVAVLEYQRAGLPVPPALFTEAADLPADFLADFAHPSVELLEGEPINPVSLEVERALEASGLTDSEVARRMGTSPAGVARLRNYFYRGHSLDALRRLGEALGQEPVLSFRPVPVPGSSVA